MSSTANRNLKTSWLYDELYRDRIFGRRHAQVRRPVGRLQLRRPELVRRQSPITLHDNTPELHHAQAGGREQEIE